MLINYLSRQENCSADLCLVGQHNHFNIDFSIHVLGRRSDDYNIYNRSLLRISRRYVQRVQLERFYAKIKSQNYDEQYIIIIYLVFWSPGK